MNFQKTLLLACLAIISLAAIRPSQGAQALSTEKFYQQMTQKERASFIAQQARRIARCISGTDYEFTPEYEAEIQQAVDAYAQRIGNSGGDVLWTGDARFIFERGQTYAPMLMSAFKAQGISPLIGLYIPLIESEYVNIQQPNSVGAIGMFQFLPKTGARYGLTPQELLDVGKSAAAAARYIADGLEQFKDDPMKEALALLAYNRGEQKTARDLQAVITEQNKRCSICALTAARARLDATFQNENVFYVQRFFAAAIIGENPQAFGLRIAPLSSVEMKP